MIDELPAAPDPAIHLPSEFPIIAAAFVLAQKRMVPQINEALANFNAASAGGAYAIPYVFDTATADADPGPGKLRLSSATQNAATVMRLDLTAGNQDYTSVLDTFDASTSAVKGSIRLSKFGDPTKWMTFDVTARAAPSGYRNLSVVCTGSSSASPFANGDGVLLYFQRSGDKGDAGSLTPVLWVRDEKVSNTGGGTAAPSSFIRRTLNTIKKNSIPGASVAGDQFTLPAGNYRLRASAPAFNVSGHRAQLYNVTDGIATDGQSAYASGSAASRSEIGPVEFLIASTKTFEIRHWTATGTANNGLGFAANTGSAEVYTEVFIEKVS